MAQILLAEDDESMRAFLARALERVGHQVTAVADGFEALPYVANNRFDLDIVRGEVGYLSLVTPGATLGLLGGVGQARLTNPVRIAPVFRQRPDPGPDPVRDSVPRAVRDARRHLPRRARRHLPRSDER